MGSCLARAALARGHEVTIVSGPVAIRYPQAARVIPVTTTAEMLAAALGELPGVDGVIAAAAPCDFEPTTRSRGKIQRTAAGLSLRLRSTTDVIATLARARSAGRVRRRPPWCVAFALEPGADRERACRKLSAKRCDLVVVNDLGALESPENRVAVYDTGHELVGEKAGSKAAVARWLIRLIERQFCD
jgi:phosphopantothenoylcysteine decarboxylase/phosphopantothenate--cysteine ligase